MSADCLVCREIAGQVELPGGFLVDEKLVLAFHIPPLEGPHYLGHLLVVPRRRGPGLADVSDEEAAAVGVAAARSSRALVAQGADHVFSAVIGTGQPHLHVHLVPRYPETPRDVLWHAVDEWEGARRGDAEEIAELVGRLRRHLN